MSSRVAAATSLAVLTFLALMVIPGASGQASDPEASRQILSPGWSKDDFSTEMAVGGGSLWLAKVGLDSAGKKRLKVLRFREGKWQTLPGRPAADGAFLAILNARDPSRVSPCVAMRVKTRNSVRCFESGRWINKVIPQKWNSTKRSYANGLSIHKGSLVLLMNSCSEKRGNCLAQTLKLRNSSFAPFGPAIRSRKHAIWGFVRSRENEDSRLRVNMVDNFKIRKVWTLKGSKWSGSRSLPTADEGESRNAVFVDGRTYFPVNDTMSDDYVFSVWSQNAGPKGKWRLTGGERMNQGFGNAQGNLFLLGKTVWAIWSEFDVKDAQIGDMFPVKTFAAKLKPGARKFGKPLVLRESQLFTAFYDQVVQFKGRPVFLYTRQWERSGGMHVTVDFRSVKQIRADMRARDAEAAE